MPRQESINRDLAQVCRNLQLDIDGASLSPPPVKAKASSLLSLKPGLGPQPIGAAAHTDAGSGRGLPRSHATGGADEVGAEASVEPAELHGDSKRRRLESETGFGGGVVAYALSAVVVHRGTASSGHYVSDVILRRSALMMGPTASPCPRAPAASIATATRPLQSLLCADPAARWEMDAI